LSCYCRYDATNAIAASRDLSNFDFSLSSCYEVPGSELALDKALVAGVSFRVPVYEFCKLSTPFPSLLIAASKAFSYSAASYMNRTAVFTSFATVPILPWQAVGIASAPVFKVQFDRP